MRSWTKLLPTITLLLAPACSESAQPGPTSGASGATSGSGQGGASSSTAAGGAGGASGAGGGSVGSSTGTGGTPSDAGNGAFFQILQPSYEHVLRQGEKPTDFSWDTDAWAISADGTTAVALFNRGLKPYEVAARWQDIGVTGRQRAAGRFGPFHRRCAVNRRGLSRRHLCLPRSRRRSDPGIRRVR